MSGLLTVLFAPSVIALIVALAVQAVAEIVGAGRSNL